MKNIQYKELHALSPGLPPTIRGHAVDSPHWDAPLEWWFFHGCFHGRSDVQSHFMVALFRNRFESDDGRSPGHFALLTAVLDPAEDRHYFSSRVQASSIDSFVAENRERRFKNVDGRLSNSYLNELRDWGVPEPVQRSNAPVTFDSARLDVVWDDLELREHAGSFELAFTDPQSGRHCRFRLDPGIRHDLKQKYGRESPRELFSSVHYVTYPRMTLEGDVDGFRVAGRCWMDHQWGCREGWTQTSTAGNALAWTWFGINLEDGSDWIVLSHNEVGTGRILRQYAVHVGDDVNNACGRHVFEEIELTPAGSWTSPRTGISYPLAWRIKVPGADLELQFESLVDDQEIIVLGLMRAIWEGAGKVAGEHKGCRVQGRARLELAGYGYVVDFQNHLERHVERIDEVIEAFLPREIDQERSTHFAGAPRWTHDTQAYTEGISRPVWDLMSRKGKHWRPLFGALMLEALGTSVKPYEDLAYIIPELCHLGTLIVDDVQDEGTLRRGERCIHLKYGTDVAINAANTMYFLPFILIDDHPHLTEAQRTAIYRIMVRGFVQGHLGQTTDIHWSRIMSTEKMDQWTCNEMIGKVLQMYAYKTASGVVGMARTACVIAEADAYTTEACARFAETFGVAFQMIDDVNDYGGNEEWRKAIGEDIRQGKVTYIVLRAVQVLTGMDRLELVNILGSSRLRADAEQRDRAIDLVRQSGMMDACRQEAQDMVQAQWVELSRFMKPSEPKIMLRALCDSLLDLSFNN